MACIYIYEDTNININGARKAREKLCVLLWKFSRPPLIVMSGSALVWTPTINTNTAVKTLLAHLGWLIFYRNHPIHGTFHGRLFNVDPV